jgi:hypothetical protein
MRKNFTAFLTVRTLATASAPSYFKLEDSINPHEFRFELVSDLIIVHTQFNRKPVKSILDKGPNRTLLFNCSDVDSF